MKLISNKRHIAIFIVVICSIFISLYLPRFIHVMHVRKSFFQAKTFRLTFRSYTASHIKGNKNLLTVSDYQLLLPLETEIRVGDRLEVISSADSKVQSLFSDRLSLTAQSIRVYRPTSSFGKSSFFQMLELLEEFPQVVTRRLSGCLEPTQAAFLTGIVFGGTGGLPKALLSDTKNTGLIHITSASGFNLTLLLMFSLAMFSRVFNRRIAALISLVLMFAYSIMTGFTPPIMRAMLMSLFYIWSIVSGRVYQARWALILSGMGMLLLSPFLIFSVSFQLSFLATAGVLYESVLHTKSKQESLKSKKSVIQDALAVITETLWSTGSVLLWTTPIILKYFETFSLVSPLANALLLWMVGPLMLAGITAVFLLFLSKILLSLFVIPLGLALDVFIQTIHLLAKLPLSNINVSAPAWWGIILYYFCLVIFIIYRLATKAEDCS